MCANCEWHDRGVNAAQNFLRRAELPASVRKRVGKLCGIRCASLPLAQGRAKVGVRTVLMLLRASVALDLRFRRPPGALLNSAAGSFGATLLTLGVWSVCGHAKR
jgi:hypothetical protein